MNTTCPRLTAEPESWPGVELELSQAERATAPIREEQRNNPPIMKPRAGRVTDLSIVISVVAPKRGWENNTRYFTCLPPGGQANSGHLFPRCYPTTRRRRYYIRM